LSQILVPKFATARQCRAVGPKRHASYGEAIIVIDFVKLAF